MQEFKGNSFKDREEAAKKNNEREPVKKVVNSKVQVRKKSGIQKLTNNLISDSAPKVKDYIVMDVLLPSIKKAISDIIKTGIDMILYGEARNNDKSNIAASKVSYRSYYNGGNNNSGVRASAYRSTYSYDEILIEDRGEAEVVLNSLCDIIDRYGFARVADYYDLFGITGSYTDNNYGWTNLSTARIDRVNGGYVIRLPRALPLD